MSAASERQLRALRSAHIRGAGAAKVPPLVRRSPALAVAVLGMEDALAALLSQREPSPWRANARLLRVLTCESVDFSGWEDLRVEVDAARAACEDDLDAVVHRLLAHMDDAVAELDRLAGA